VAVKSCGSSETFSQQRSFGVTMTRKTRPYRDLRLERLANPEVAAHYLNTTQESSPSEFLSALKNVAKARQMAKVAKEAGVQRETLYRSLSEQGNPTWDTLRAVLSAVGIRVKFAAEGEEAESSPPSPPPVVAKTNEGTKPVNLLLGDEQHFDGAGCLWGGQANNFAAQGSLL
jgi:probable addiction module antidote protein